MLPLFPHNTLSLLLLFGWLFRAFYCLNTRFAKLQLTTKHSKRNQLRLLISMSTLTIQERKKVWQLNFYSMEFKKSQTLLSQYLVNKVATLSNFFAFQSSIVANTANATVKSWQSGHTVHFIPMLFLTVLNAKQGSSVYHFSSHWYDSTGASNPSLLHSKQAFYHWVVNSKDYGWYNTPTIKITQNNTDTVIW